MQHSSRLQAIGIPRELQNTVEDLSSEGTKLFFKKIDAMYTLKNSHATLHLLDVYTPVPEETVQTIGAVQVFLPLKN